MTKKVNKYGGGGYGYTRRVNGKWWGWGVTIGSLCQLVQLTCPHVTNLTDMPSPGASLGTPGDRQHIDKQAFPWHPSTRGQTT